MSSNGDKKRTQSAERQRRYKERMAAAGEKKIALMAPIELHDAIRAEVKRIINEYEVAK